MNSVDHDTAQILRAELLRPLPQTVTALAAAIAEAGSGSVAAVLFYGSCLRDPAAEGILDFYVLVDDYRRYHGSRLPAFLNRLLPPTVSLQHGKDGAKAKVAVMSRRQFAGRMRPESLDVTLWSRFCQPVALAHARDDGVVDWTVEIMGRAVSTAALWAVWLGPAEGHPADYWVGLFRQTYRSELRPEGQDRASAIHAVAADRYDRLLRAGLTSAGGGVEAGGEGRLRPVPGRAAPWWWLRRATGKLLTVARLAKASFTFANGADYLVWKIERHTGERITLARWQREHPLMAAPLILWRLWRRGIIR